MPAGVTYEPIATSTPSGVSTVNFSSFSGYTDLVISMPFIWTSGSSNIGIRFNSDTGSNYSDTRILGNGSSAITSRDSNNTYISALGGSWTVTTNPGFVKFSIFSYAGSTNKTVFVETSLDQNGSGATLRGVGLWRNTSAITSIDVFTVAGSNFTTGTRLTIYGIKNSA